MGFGVFNNVAISAQYALNTGKFKKILIVDFDVHHGNGTQHIFENNSIFTTHQVINTLIIQGLDHLTKLVLGIYLIVHCLVIVILGLLDPYLEKNIVDKIDRKFDLIYFSAGFDAHKLDPLASINLEDDDFYWVTKIILEKFANNVPIISVLEGGYDMIGLHNGLNNHLKRLVEYSNE